MLAWVMNLGFAASPANMQAPPPGMCLPFGMDLGDGLWLTCLLASMILWRIA